MSWTFPRWGGAAVAEAAPRGMPPTSAAALCCASRCEGGFVSAPACPTVPMAVLLQLRIALPIDMPALGASAWPPSCCCCCCSCGLRSALRARCRAAARGPWLPEPEAAAAGAESCRLASRLERMASCRAFIPSSGSTALGALRNAMPASTRSAQLPEDCFPHRELLVKAPLARRAASRPRATSTSSCDGPPALQSADVCKERKRLSTAESTSERHRRGDGLGEVR